MTDAPFPFPPIQTATLLADAPDFTSVPMARSRHDGWTPERQHMFIAALSATGTVDSAARSVGMTRMAAYNLRKREGAESFGQAWDLAIDSGRARVFDYAMDRALNGVTTLRLRLGGTIDISHGPDKALITTMLKSPLPGDKGTVHAWGLYTATESGEQNPCAVSRDSPHAGTVPV